MNLPLEELAGKVDLPTVTVRVQTPAAAHRVTRNRTETEDKDTTAIMGMETTAATSNGQL